MDSKNDALFELEAGASAVGWMLKKQNSESPTEWLNPDGPADGASDVQLGLTNKPAELNSSPVSFCSYFLLPYRLWIKTMFS